MTTAERRRVPPAERQFSLVLALVRTERGLSKADVLESVHGYRQLFEADGASVKLDRLFERDKEELRELGISIDTIDDPAAPGDNQLTRYRIRESALRVDEALSLDPDEAALVSLAAAVWREGALAGESRRAVFKLRARGVDVRELPVSIAPRFRMREGAFEPLSNAITSGDAVSFDYRAAGAVEAQRRRVEPLALVHFGGHWLLAAFDLDRGAERRFLLGRIEGAIGRTGEIDPTRAAALRDRDVAQETLEALHSHAASNPVMLAISEGSDAELRLRARVTPESREADGSLRARLEAADTELLANELASYGPEVTVIEPEALRDAVRSRLERALREHSDEGEPA